LKSLNWQTPFNSGLALAITLLLSACSTGSEQESLTSGTAETLIVYSGRNQSLIEDLLRRFEETTGQKTEVRYGGTAELAATLLEEGSRTPCDVFIAQDAAALGAVAQRNLFRPLPSDVLERIPSQFRSPQGEWVGLSGRARVVVYNTESTTPENLPQSLEEIADQRFKGRFGVAPVNGSFQAHMAVYHAVHGPEALDKLLRGIVANAPQRYPKNSAIVEAVIQGEVDWGLVNHYYLWRALKENPEAPAKNFAMPWDASGGVASFVNLAGAGALSEHPGAAQLLRFLVSDEAQRYFADQTFEYPLVEGIEPTKGLTPLAELAADQLDFGRVSASLEDALKGIAATGLLD
jgi:iron(III) transport system substrate-binding protein